MYNREQVLANCQCEEDRAALNSLSDEGWTGLLASLNAKAEGSNADVIGSGKFQQAGGEGKKEEYKLSGNYGEDDEEDEEEGGDEEDMETYSSGRTTQNRGQVTYNQWVNMAPPEGREALAELQALSREKKLNVVRKLVANITDPTRRKAQGDRLMSKPINELREMLELVGTPAPRLAPHTRRPSPLFTGAAAPATNAGATSNARAGSEPLVPPSIDYAELVAEQTREAK